MSDEFFAALPSRAAPRSLSGRRCVRNTIGELSDLLEAMETHIHSELAKLRAERRGESSQPRTHLPREPISGLLPACELEMMEKLVGPPWST
jgi:hypothetical protein